MFFKDFKNESISKAEFSDIVIGLGIEKKETDLLCGFLFTNKQSLQVSALQGALQQHIGYYKLYNDGNDV
jgi:hypothetical protein